MSDLNVYTTSQINALTPITGDMVVDSDLNAVKLYDGAAWRTWNSDSTVVPFYNRWGASFDGADDYLDISGASGVFNNATTFSISLWYYARGYGGAVFGCGTSGTNGIWILPYNSTNLYLSIRNGAGGSVSAADPGLNKWVHVVATYNSGASTIYITPEGASTSTYSGTLSTSLSSTAGTDLRIGMLPATFNLKFNGLIDEVAIFDTTLDQAAVTALYGASPNAGIPSEVTGAAGWWRMGDDSSDTATSGGSIATITDSSGNGNDATQSSASAQPTFSDLTGETIYV